jgi:hypothetical protein
MVGRMRAFVDQQMLYLQLRIVSRRISVIFWWTQFLKVRQPKATKDRQKDKLSEYPWKQDHQY